MQLNPSLGTSNPGQNYHCCNYSDRFLWSMHSWYLLGYWSSPKSSLKDQDDMSACATGGIPRVRSERSVDLADTIDGWAMFFPPSVFNVTDSMFTKKPFILCVFMKRSDVSFLNGPFFFWSSQHHSTFWLLVGGFAARQLDLTDTNAYLAGIIGIAPWSLWGARHRKIVWFPRCNMIVFFQECEYLLKKTSWTTSDIFCWADEMQFSPVMNNY